MWIIIIEKITEKNICEIYIRTWSIADFLLKDEDDDLAAGYK